MLSHTLHLRITTQQALDNIKRGLGQLKARGAKIVAINPVRTGYGAIADEWIGIRPGTDGLLAFALIHELLRMDRIDLDYLVRYANAHWLVIDNPGGADDGMFARDADGNALCWNTDADACTDATAIDISPAVVGRYALPDGRNARPVFQLIVDRYLDLLRAGGSRSPQELLAPFAIDLNDPAFWHGGLDIIESMLGEVLA